MSGGLWFFFWTESDWTGGAPPPPPPPAPTSAPSEGSGGGKKNDLYTRASDDFWDTREAYLRSLVSEMQPEPPSLPTTPAGIPPAPLPISSYFNYKLLPRYISERSNAIELVRSASDLGQLQSRISRLRELNIAVETARRQKWTAERPARVASRKRRARLAKRKLAALQSANILLLLLSRSGY